MLDPNRKIDANSTWEPAPRRQWLLKFFASLALLGFLVGLMFGRLLDPPAEPKRSNSVVQLQTYADGLAVCLTEPAQIQSSNQQGAYQLLFLATQGQPAQGELFLANSTPVRWRVESQDEVLRIVFIGLQPLVGQWQPRLSETSWCVDIQISLASPVSRETNADKLAAEVNSND